MAKIIYEVYQNKNEHSADRMVARPRAVTVGTKAVRLAVAVTTPAATTTMTVKISR